MDRLFLRRASAVSYLLNRRRALLEGIAVTPSGNADSEFQGVELIERLILDVRAGRVHAFGLDQPEAVTVFVSD
ncbi:hypothetical protein [Paraburkholderia sp. RL17-337-BIB-A]|uniref:hypothetical protein n=1 Tax=Paraburkholderia sp. RL17-337-BIB-A TaxID=3031636 RepID=UPI0038B7707A